VSAVEAISPEVIVAQVKAVAEDIGVDAVKIGMLGTVATIQAVAESLDLLAPATPVVLDPVMVSESGAELLEASAQGALLELLLPRVRVITPNLPEARALAAAALASVPEADETGDDAAALARVLHALGPEVVVVTGGHRHQAVDVFFDGSEVVQLPGERYPGGAAHGSGCTHSSVLAARLAWGDAPLEAARTAKRLAAQAVRDGLAGVGAGAGPVNILGVT
jgi:hydroxymethylpyrimidine/phosphomethylpyrimidine kinase